MFAGLPFSLAVTTGIILIVSLATVLTLAIIGVGWYSLLTLALPVVAYVVCFAIGKKYGEFYASRMGSTSAKRVKTWVWLHELEDALILKELTKNETIA
jgi:hypothetical protein